MDTSQHFSSINEFYEYIRSFDIEYPHEALDNQIQGKVFVQFIHTKEGKIIEPKVVKGIGYGCDELALSLFTEFYGTIKHQLSRGKPADQRYVIPIIFNLPKQYPDLPKLDNDSILSFINCKRALESSDQEFIGHHLAALKYFDNQMIHRSPIQLFRSLLMRSLVNKKYNDTLRLYKFPLYSPNGDFSLIDEPRSNYDFYALIVDEKEQVIVSHYFLYYGKVKNRPKYDAFEFDKVEDTHQLIEQIKKDYKKAQISRNAIRQLSVDRSSERTIDFLHNLLKSNIRKGTGHERESYTSNYNGITEWGIHESLNHELIAALSKLEAHKTIPDLYSLLDYPSEEIGIEKHNLLYYLYNLTEESIGYLENGEKLIYPENHAILVQEWVENRK
ncbi:energy transducer TonB [Fulvivirga sp. M361]|uniref:energy transducer TonB n=1 Tax=Fulvivirga sp. M361 TaxID=2594266 RepID=UPI00162A41A2|nr:energy transducer TonB [Fulvivirga sp. M361]